MAVSAPPQDVYSAVHPVAAKYGVPDSLWEAIAFMESGYNPSVIGDHGTSFGLFQLHQGGQLTTSPASVLGTKGETQNALEAMPSIAKAWQSLQSTFSPSQLSWWQQFAAQSGHPGGVPGNPNTDQAAQSLMQDYIGGMTLNQQSTPQTNSNCPGYCALTPFATWGPCSGCTPADTGNQQANSALQNLNSGLQDLVTPGWWARVGIILLGGLFIIIGFMKLSR